MKQFFLCIMLCALASLQSGCVVAALNIAAAGVSTTVSAMDEEVSQSYPYPYWCVYRATHAALNEMAIPVSSIERTDEGDKFFATTRKYPVIIELREVTPSLVNVSVSAGNNVFQLDAATGQAIVNGVQDVIRRSLTAGLYQ